MERQGRLRRIQLVAYDYPTLPHLDIPPITPGPTPSTLRLPICRPRLQKIRLISVKQTH